MVLRFRSALSGTDAVSLPTYKHYPIPLILAPFLSNTHVVPYLLTSLSQERKQRASAVSDEGSSAASLEKQLRRTLDEKDKLAQVPNPT